MRKPYYHDEKAQIRLYLGDTWEVMTELYEAEERFRLVFTSPPYNLGKSSGGGVRQKVVKPQGSRWAVCPLKDGYGGHTDDMPLAEYETWQRLCLARMWSVLTDDGAIFYNHKPRIQDGELWLPTVLNPGLPLRQIITWDRGSGMNFNPTYYLPRYEWVMLFPRPGWRLRSQGASGLGDVWYIPFHQDNPHPAPFPVGLPDRGMDTTKEGPVLDPFVGSGTTAIAAKARGWPCVGIDNFEPYLEYAAARLSQDRLPLDVDVVPSYEAAGARSGRLKRQQAREKREKGAR